MKTHALAGDQNLNRDCVRNTLYWVGVCSDAMSQDQAQGKGHLQRRDDGHTSPWASPSSRSLPSLMVSGRFLTNILVYSELLSPSARSTIQWSAYGFHHRR